MPVLILLWLGFFASCLISAFDILLRKDTGPAAVTGGAAAAAAAAAASAASTDSGASSSRTSSMFSTGAGAGGCVVSAGGAGARSGGGAVGGGRAPPAPSCGELDEMASCVLTWRQCELVRSNWVQTGARVSHRSFTVGRKLGPTPTPRRRNTRPATRSPQDSGPRPGLHPAREVGCRHVR